MGNTAACSNLEVDCVEPQRQASVTGLVPSVRTQLLGAALLNQLSKTINSIINPVGLSD
jgi:hypothetical protein